MAFYPDELSPIDRLSTLQKANDLSDINLLKNRRQWKSLVLGKKEMGLNNFATITEEKEDEISSDESLGGKKLSSSLLKSTSDGTTKKITFPKPKKYITPTITDKFNNEENNESSPSLIKSSVANSDNIYKKEVANELRNSLNALKGNKQPESKNIERAKKSQEALAPKKEIIEHYVFSTMPTETQWNKVSETGCLTGWPKMKGDKDKISKYDSVKSLKLKAEDKKKSGEVNIKLSVGLNKGKHESKSKLVKKKGSKKGKNLNESNDKEETSDKPKTKKGTKKIKPKIDKGESLNMKEVVNMYKNLAYGSKDEIKSFVEKLSFVKDDSENDKNLLSVMNLKALEYKIKNFGKKSGKAQTNVPEEKKLKVSKNVRRSKKAHIEKLARHKIVKVPAVSNAHYVKAPSSRSFADEKKSGEQKGKKQIPEDKEPWKYVGTNSVLDKSYIVYPAYQPSSSPKKTKKNVKRAAVGAGEDKSKKDDANLVTSKSLNLSQQRPKVKHPEVVIRSKAGRDYKSRSRSTRLANSLSVRSMSDKRLNRFSATTVCTIKFRPSISQTTHNQFPLNESEPTDPSLLVYLHGSKAVNVKTPYSDRQFSRVKFFRNNDREIPLIKGLSRKGLTPNYQNCPVKNISLPEKFCSFRSLDLLNFDEDIQNITDFLHSQTNLSPERPEGSPSPRKNRHPWSIKCPREEDQGGAQTQIRLNRQIRSQNQHHDSRHYNYQNHRHSHNNRCNHHYHRHHQHGTKPEALSPDSFFNEISKYMQQLQFLPDTEESRKLISRFFEELDHRIEASKDGQLFLQQLPSLDNSHIPIPILGY